MITDKRKIKFVDLKKLHEPIIKDINESINKVVNKSNFILGEDVQIFEENWARYTKQKYAIGVSSGYHALELAKRTCSLYEYSDILIPTNSFIATANAFYNDWNDIIFSDINSDNLLLDAKDLEENLKLLRFDDDIVDCIVPVHLYGQPCEMDKISSICKKYDVKIIEDACQSHGVNPRLIGKGLCTTYSFYPSKNLGCFGDGGIITTNDQEIYEKLKLLRSYGENPKNQHKTIGYNCRLDTIQAAILNVKLNYLDEWNNQRRDTAKQYHEELEGKLDNNNIRLIPYNRESVYHLFVIETKNRDNLRNYLSENGIETGIHYPIPIHKQMAYNNYNNISLPIAEKKADMILSLPMHPYIESDEISYVCNKIKEFYS